ncbi:MAG: DUF11 domain-containing protein, partial [Caldilinea sp.]|nr:DUF11 domain-containing protein [Caldilinea sp.]
MTDPYYDIPGGASDVGAVYLYNGDTHEMISMLLGSTANDSVGSGGVTVLSNGNFVVKSKNWGYGGATNVGAVTWGSAVTGISGTVSAANSLVGAQADDGVGERVIALNNGNYVVDSRYWANGSNKWAGAATWGNGNTGVSGIVYAANSLIGSSASDFVGQYIIPLSNGNYVVGADTWDNGSIAGAGAVTWGNGATGVAGVISSANSLVGTQTADSVGREVIALPNGNYVVRSAYWDNGGVVNAGAVTWADGTKGITGTISPVNSLVGSSANDYVGYDYMYGVLVLANGNYVVRSSGWDNGGTANVGAVTWGNGATGTVGTISAANSLIGSTANDGIGGGNGSLIALPNGNYVVCSSMWDNGGVVDAGAVTWGNGATGTSGVVSAINSLVGSSASDQIGFAYGNALVTPLSNGNYVVRSPNWDNGAVADAGAVTWGNGTSGTSGTVSVANSLVGSTASDQIGYGDVITLTNGNFVASSPNWDNGGVVDAGAVTWGNGTTGSVGTVSATNSLVGSSASDKIGSDSPTALANGNYVVRSPYWDNGGISDAGAVTWGNGAGGISGAVSAANSLVGTTASGRLSRVTALNNGNYVVSYTGWANGAMTNAGSVTWADGTKGITETISAANSLVGSKANDYVGREVLALANGNYVVDSYYWDNGTVVDAGAVTWADGTTGITGTVSAVNSLVGSSASDQIGSNYDFMSGAYGTVRALSDGNYIVLSASWDNGATVNSGSVTWGDGTTGTRGEVSAINSVIGGVANGGGGLSGTYNPVYEKLLVGRRLENSLTVFPTAAPLTVDLTKSVAPSSEVMWNGVMTYTLVLANTGNVSDTNVVLSDTLPSKVDFAYWIDQSGANIENDVVSWAGPVVGRESITITFAVTNAASGGATITNTAWFSGSAQTGTAAAAFTTSSTLTPSGSGNWSDIFPPCSGICNYVIPPGVTVTLNGDINLSGNFEIQPGGTFDPNGKTVTLTGDQPQ